MHRILHLFRQVGDGNRPKGTFAHTDAAANAKVLGDEGLAVHKDYGLVARAYRWAEVLALFGALAGLAAIAIDDGNSHALPQLRRSVQVTSQKSTTMNST